MNFRRITKWLLVIIAAVLIIYDIFPFIDQTRRDTISEVILEYGLHLFTLPFAFGVLVGHFFWPWEGHYPKPKILFPLAALSIGLDIIAHCTDGIASNVLQYAQTYPIIVCLIGIPLGHFFWPQQKSDKLGGDDL